MARAALTAAAAAAVLAACTPVEATDDVFPSVLPATAPTAPGPSYVLLPPDRDPPTVHTASGSRELGITVHAVSWTNDGHLLAQGRNGIVALDPATGAHVGFDKRSQVALGVTPEAVTTRGYRPTRLRVLTPDLADPRVIDVPESAMRTDQVDEGNPEAYRTLHDEALTLDGVTWVQWLVNSEDDEKDDHGILRIEGDEIVEVQRNEPVVRLYASADGAALLMLRQSSGVSECAGCVTSQELVELDPRTGEVAAEYDMPPDYERFWRVDAVDKIGDRVAVRFQVASSEAVDAEFEWQTWAYDGEWRRVTEAGATRTWWQDGGRLVETPERERKNLSGVTPYRLEWVSDDGRTSTELTPDADTCWRQTDGETWCPEVVAPGSLVPPVKQ